MLKGSLAPDGAVLKKATSSPHLHKHRGPAIVFEGPDDAERVDDPALGITPEHVLVLRGAGPVALGMPEAGSMPLPKHLAAQGITDMVRVSDGRMSGTAYGTVALHVAPEAAIGGPLALVRDGRPDRVGRRSWTLRFASPRGNPRPPTGRMDCARRASTWMAAAIRRARIAGKLGRGFRFYAVGATLVVALSLHPTGIGHPQEMPLHAPALVLSLRSR